jgi:hypothetical protein
LATSFVFDPNAHPCNYSRRSLAVVLQRAGFYAERFMEHLMVSYPLKHVLNRMQYNDRRSRPWPPGKRRLAASLFLTSFPFDRVIPRGGIDITVFARLNACFDPTEALGIMTTVSGTIGAVSDSVSR